MTRVFLRFLFFIFPIMKFVSLFLSVSFGSDIYCCVLHARHSVLVKVNDLFVGFHFSAIQRIRIYINSNCLQKSNRVFDQSRVSPSHSISCERLCRKSKSNGRLTLAVCVKAACFHWFSADNCSELTNEIHMHSENEIDLFMPFDVKEVC